MLRIVFAGTSPFAAGFLSYLHAKSYDPLLVITKEDSRAGRGKKLVPSAVANFAEQVGFPVCKPNELTESTLRMVSELRPDLILVVAYGKIIPLALLNLPRHGCWNIHTSILPAYRGAAPIERSLLDGVDATGVTLMQMDEGLDTGDIISQASFSVDMNHTKEEVSKLMLDNACVMLDEALSELATKGAVTRQAQNHALASYAHKITKDELWIDWNLAAVDVVRKAHALYPHARSLLSDKVIKILRVKLVNNIEGQSKTNIEPGVIISFDEKGILVQCLSGCVRVVALQVAGKNTVHNPKLLLHGYAKLFAEGKKFQRAEEWATNAR